MIINDVVPYLGQNVSQSHDLKSYFKGLSIDIERALEVEEGFDNEGIYKCDGELPYGVLFSDTCDVISEKIGSSPDFVNEYIKRWDNLDGIRISLSSINDNMPSIVVIGKGNNLVI